MPLRIDVHVMTGLDSAWPKLSAKQLMPHGHRCLTAASSTALIFILHITILSHTLDLYLDSISAAGIEGADLIF
jgi:hypothetical protein